MKFCIFASFQLKPIYFTVVNTLDKIFLHTVAAISSKLLVEIVRGATGSNFSNQFRRAFDETISINACLPAANLVRWKSFPYFL